MLRNERGNSYIIVLILIAIVAALSAGTMQYMATTQSDVQVTSAKMAQLNLIADVAASLQLSDTCGLMLSVSPLNLTGPSNATVRWRVTDDPPGQPMLIRAGATMRDYQLTVESLSISTPVFVGDLTPPRKLYRTTLDMDTKGIHPARDYQPGKVADLYIEVESGAIVRCYGVSDVVNLTTSACLSVNAKLASDGTCRLQPNLPGGSCPSGFIQSFSSTGMNCGSFQ